METFHNVCLLAHDIARCQLLKSRTFSFIGSIDNIRVVWDYCILSKLEADSSSEVLDESDNMQIFKQLESFYIRHKTLPVRMEQDIMDLFRYYCARDVILEASRHLEYNNEDTLVDSEKEDMDTEVVIHDNGFDTLSNCEQFYQKFKGKSGKEVFALFSQFQTGGIDMNKIDLLIMQKSKLFFQLEKKKGLPVNTAGLLFSEEESVHGWNNRSLRDIKFRKPKSFEELETWDQGHTYECFHNLDIEVINAEIKALRMFP